MSLPTWWGSSLPCGCVRGVKLCRDAEKLWDAVADAHNGVAHAFTHDTANDLALAQNRYEAALSRFTAHVSVEVENAVQGAML